MDFQILTHTLDIPYIIDFHTNNAVLSLEEQRVVIIDLRYYRFLMPQVILLLHLVGSLLEVGKRERFKQIIDRIDLVSVNGIIAVSRRENHYRRHVKAFHEVHSVDIRHVNVDEQRINGLLVHDSLCLGGTLTLATQFQKIHLIYICSQLAQCQRLIIYC